MVTVTTPGKLIVFSSVGLALSSLGLVWVAKHPFALTKMADPAAPRHPVTAEMEQRAKAMNQKIAPYAKHPNAGGGVTTLGGNGGRPQFIYSIKKGCPCSREAEPVMVRLAAHWKGEIDVIAITDHPAEGAKQWVKDFGVQHAIVPDPKLELLGKYELPAAMYCTLVDQNGLIAGRWAGYSKAYLSEMLAAGSKLVGKPVRPFDMKQVPIENTSGCPFEAP